MTVTRSRRRSPSESTLTQLEHDDWGEPPADAGYLVKTCHALRSKPIKEMTVEDLRILIGQQIGLRFVVPRALDVLEKNPMAQGDFYPGDLLLSVLRIDAEFWATDSALAARVIKIAESVVEGALSETDPTRRRG